MSLLDYKINRRITCFGSKVYGFKIYGCLLDITIAAIESIESINDLWKFYEEKNKQALDADLFWMHHNSFYIGCCKTHIDRIFSTNYQNMSFADRFNCKHFRALPLEKCCLDPTSKLSDLCFHCLDTLSDILVKKLHTFTTPKEFLLESFWLKIW